MNNYNQQRHANPSSVGTMIPTPGLQHSGGNPNMMMTSSVDAAMDGSNNITTTAMNTANMLNPGGMLGGSFMTTYIKYPECFHSYSEHLYLLCCR